MSHTDSLLLFAGLVFGVVVLPGLDMAFVMSSSLVAGRRHGLAAVAGVIAGGICLVVMITLSIGTMLRVIPGAFNALLIAGAMYIAWIGLSLLRSKSAFVIENGEEVQESAWVTFRRGALTCLMNPKAYMFMLAVYPQFLRAEYGPLWSQMLILWSIIAITQLVVYGAVALSAAQARVWMTRKPDSGVVVARVVGVILIAAAVGTACGGWRA